MKESNATAMAKDKQKVDETVLHETTTAKGKHKIADEILQLTAMAKAKRKADDILDAPAMQVNGEHKVVDEIVLELTDSIGERLNVWSQKQMNADDFTISRVPAAIRRGKEVYYEPTIVSIGPYHRGKEKYEAMEEHKWGQLCDFLFRNPDIGINTYLTELRKLENEARRCYFEDIKLSSKEFVEMMLLDGCFILELFHKYCYPECNSYARAPISFNSNIVRQVFLDLLLLENQIPFFILQCLFDNMSGEKDNSFLLTLASECISQFYVFPSTYDVDVLLNRDEIYDHLLHLFHCVHQPIKEPVLIEPNYCKPLFVFVEMVPKWLKHLKLVSPCFLCLRKTWLNLLKLVALRFCCLRRKEVAEQKRRTTIPCATNLVEAGITFERKNSKSFLEVTFNDGKVEVPCFFIDDSGRSLMMNLIAFEQCNLPSHNRFVSFYAFFMDQIIDTPKDVEILQQSKILESYINSDKETANFFNRLSDQVVITSKECYLLPVIEKINEYCETSWHQWRAKLMRDYFSNPWAILSVVAAIILLILTFLQTFFAVYSYFKPSK